MAHPHVPYKKSIEGHPTVPLWTKHLCFSCLTWPYIFEVYRMFIFCHRDTMESQVILVRWDLLVDKGCWLLPWSHRSGGLRYILPMGDQARWWWWWWWYYHYYPSIYDSMFEISFTINNCCCWWWWWWCLIFLCLKKRYVLSHFSRLFACSLS